MLTETYLPSRDGVVSSILITKTKLEEMGHEVFVLAPDPSDAMERDPEVHYFRSVEFKHYPGYRVSCFPSDKVRVIESLDVDVIHCHSVLFFALRSLFAGRALGIPVVVTYHTMVTEAMMYYTDLPLDQAIAERLFWVYLRSLLQRADAVVAPTEAIRRELMERAPAMRHIEAIPTGVDLSRFSPEVDGREVRARYGLEDKRVLLHLGRVAPEKNIQLVLDAFVLLAEERGDVALLVVGEGPSRPSLEARATRMGLDGKVIFTGFVPDAELPNHYAACNAFVIASRFETQGLVVLEAMACGKPVAGIDHRAIAEVVQDGVNGYKFQDEVGSCKDAISMVLEGHETLARGAFITAQDYSVDECVSRLVDLYHKAISIKTERMGRR